MASPVKPVPDGFRTLTPHLSVKGAADAIEFYKKAFGAEEISRMPGPDGKAVMHAELKIGDSIMMIADEWPGMYTRSPKSLNGTSVNLNIYVADCDALFQRAVAAGATVEMPLMDMFWGDRYGKVTDPFGHSWGIATHKQDLTHDEVMKAAKEWMAKNPDCK
jgi:uncharacterized glyoxalase superfamily protein PhnB